MIHLGDITKIDGISVEPGEHSAATKAETSRLCSRKRSASSNRKPPVLKYLKKAGLHGAGIGTWTDDGAWLGEYTTRNTGEPV